MEGLKDDRRAVIGGGLAVLHAVLELFKIDALQVTPGALRHGLLYDLIEREDETNDIRSVTVAGLQKAFQVDIEQAKRVSKVACHFLDQLETNKPSGQDWPRLTKKLDWAAQLHEIGAQISHTDSHKHSAYILDNTDAPGFALHELHRLSLLVLGHKGKLRKLDVDFTNEGFACQLLCLRLAVILCHARREPDYKKLQLRISEKQTNRFELLMEPLWSQRFPQSQHLLQQEIVAWQKTSWELQIKPA
jgi:exopolyphosphatase/guanosine-5'-triphosphate,3'-diphosphate pyrophosphatase